MTNPDSSRERAAFGPTTESLSKFVGETGFDDLPDEVVERERWHVLDTLGCILYGTSTPWVTKIVRALDRAGERGSASVIGTDGSVPRLRAALVNGTASHSMDYDDYCQDAGVHAGSTTVPPALAYAETADRKVSGEEFLAAVTLGVETSIRSGYGIGRGSLANGWHIAGWTGAFGSAATIASLDGLPEDQVGHALAVAGTQGAGLMGATYGAEVKRFHMGKAAESGYLAAALAGESFTGDPRIFQERWGAIGPTMSDDYDVEAVTENLGSRYELLEKLSFKPYPSVGQTHAPVNAVEEIVRENDLDPEAIDRVVARVTDAAKDKSGWEYEPTGVMAAQSNVQYAIASFLVDGELRVDAYTEEMIRRPEILERVGDVEVVSDESLVDDSAAFNARYRTEVTATTSDGRAFTATVRVPRGFPENPMTEAELLAKFRNLATRVLPRERADEVAEFVLAIDERDDVSELFDLLSP